MYVASRTFVTWVEQKLFLFAQNVILLNYDIDQK